MKSRSRYFVFGSVFALCLATIPIFCLLQVKENYIEIAALGLAAVAWLLVALFLWFHAQLMDVVYKTVETLDISGAQGSLSEVLSTLTEESARYHRAAYAFRSDGERNLGVNLSRVVHLAYKELSARSVELSLFDEESGLWAQSLLVGEPLSLDSQAAFAVDSDHVTDTEITTESGAIVAVRPVTFAGKLFGAIRVELHPDQEFSNNDRKVLHLLTTQGGILFVDAKFGEEALRLRQLSDETTRAKTGFLANLSHELRGPLGIILNGVELAQDGLCGEVSESLSEMLRMIRESGDHLLDLVNDVLDYAKVEAGKVTVSPVELPVKPLLEDLVSVVRSQASAKGHDLILDEVEATLGMVCDKRHARQILINFLTNAIKYTPDGGQIIVSAARSAQGRAMIKVSDNGIGIPLSQRGKVFGAFERVEDRYAMSQVGTGLGMPLTKKLTEVNGGAIDFDSAEGQGSTFWILMPSVEIDLDSVVEPKGEDGNFLPQGSGEQVLLVDHETESRAMLERYLSEHGFRVLHASSGAEVLRFLRDDRIDLAVVENDLPDMPGEEMVAAIRATPNASSTPVILLSARAFVFDIERFLKLGVDRCLSKPVSLSEVAITARRLIDESRSLEGMGAGMH